MNRRRFLQILGCLPFTGLIKWPKLAPAAPNPSEGLAAFVNWLESQFGRVEESELGYILPDYSTTPPRIDKLGSLGPIAGDLVLQGRAVDFPEVFPSTITRPDGIFPGTRDPDNFALVFGTRQEGEFALIYAINRRIRWLVPEYPDSDLQKATLIWRIRPEVTYGQGFGEKTRIGYVGYTRFAILQSLPFNTRYHVDHPGWLGIFGHEGI